MLRIICNFLYVALDLGPNDPKALYRRCLAYEGLGKIEEAYKDAAMLIKVDPKNTSVKPVLARLTPIIREKVGENKTFYLIILTYDKRTGPEKIVT